jgi:hypothetical protein
MAGLTPAIRFSGQAVPGRWFSGSLKILLSWLNLSPGSPDQ